MKQVYKTGNLEETPSHNTYVRGGVLFVGFLVWLMAVTDSFGQATCITISAVPSSSSYSVKASVKLEYLKQEPRIASNGNAQVNEDNAKSAEVNWGNESNAERFAVTSGGFAANHTYMAAGLNR